jgi:hypothetical protein
VAGAEQAPGTLPAGGKDAGGIDDYWTELAVLLGGIIAALGAAMVAAGTRRQRQP